MTVAELLAGPVLFELADPDAEEVDRGFGTGVIVTPGYSFVGLSLLVLPRELAEGLLLFNTSMPRSCSSFSSAFFKLCAILPA